MFNKIKKVSFAAVFGMVLTISGFVVNAADGISVKIDGRDINFDVPPQVINSRTMVPMRAIFEELGASVEWDATTKSINAVKGETKIKMQISNSAMYVGDVEKTLDSVPVIVDGRTLVPARAIAEALNCKVDWIEDTKSVVITSSAETSVDASIASTYPSFADFTGIPLDEYDDDSKMSWYLEGNDRVKEYVDHLVANYGFVAEAHEYGYFVENWKLKVSFSIHADGSMPDVAIFEENYFNLLSYEKLPSYEEITGEKTIEEDELGTLVYKLNSDAVVKYSQYLHDEYGFDVETEKKDSELVVRIKALGVTVVSFYCEPMFDEIWLMY